MLDKYYVGDVWLVHRNDQLTGDSHFKAKTSQVILKSCLSVASSQIWYFVSKIERTFCKKLFSSFQETLLIFKAEGRELPKLLRPMEQFIQTMKGQNNFWTYYSYLLSNTLEQLLFKLKFRNIQEILEKKISRQI